MCWCMPFWPQGSILFCITVPTHVPSSSLIPQLLLLQISLLPFTLSPHPQPTCLLSAVALQISFFLFLNSWQFFLPPPSLDSDYSPASICHWLHLHSWLFPQEKQKLDPGCSYQKSAWMYLEERKRAAVWEKKKRMMYDSLYYISGPFCCELIIIIIKAESVQNRLELFQLGMNANTKFETLWDLIWFYCFCPVCISTNNY